VICCEGEVLRTDGEARYDYGPRSNGLLGVEEEVVAFTKIRETIGAFRSRPRPTLEDRQAQHARQRPPADEAGLIVLDRALSALSLRWLGFYFGSKLDETIAAFHRKNRPQESPADAVSTK